MRSHGNKFIITILLAVINNCFNSFSQKDNTLDSLINVVETSNQDSTKIKTYLQIGENYFYSIPDSAIYFYQKAQTLANKNSNKGLQFKSLEAITLRYLGIIYFNKGIYDTSLINLQQSIKIFEIALILAKKDNLSEIIWKQKRNISFCYNDIGNVYRDMGTYDRAINYYFRSLKICEEMLSEAEKTGNTDKIMEQKKSISKCYSSIGNIHYFQNSYKKAIGYYHRSLKIFKELIILSEQNNNMKKTKEYKQGLAACYNNIGMVYSDNGKVNKANPVVRDSLYNITIEFYLKSLNIIEEIGDNSGLSKCYNNLGSGYKDIASVTKKQKIFDTALDYYLKSLQIKEEVGDRNGIATVWGNIAELHSTIADSASVSHADFINHYRYALNYGLKAYKLAKSIDAKYLAGEEAKLLLKAYIALGMTKEALEFNEITSLYNDTLFDEEKTESLTEMETKYETEKKQFEIEKLEKQKALDKETIARRDAESKKHLTIIYSFIAGFIIILIFSVIIFRLFIAKKRANIIILKKNNELEQANEEISSQRDEIEAQRDLVIIQKEEIENIHEEVTSSIRYAQRIQGAVLPASEQMADILGEHFVIFMPRNIVSGDFYWATKIKKWLIFCVADCTGHGVPGAFMSMLGISFLNEIVRKEEVTNSSDVLDNLRENVVVSLKQKGLDVRNSSGKHGVIDGMDIALCVIDTETLMLQFAGANNPLYIVRKSESINPIAIGLKEENQELSTYDLELSDCRLYELKGDKMPIATYPKMENFKNKEFQLTKSDRLYLFSDGFADQFGGPVHKKFMYKQFKELLLANSQRPMNDQKEALINTIREWIGSNEQVDDITVLGIRI